MPRVETALVVLLALSVSYGCPVLGADLSSWSDLQQALGASTSLSCSYSQATTEHGVTTVEQFVAGQNAGWSLLTVDGKPPTQSEQTDYAKGIEQRADRTSPIALNVANLVISDSVTATRNQDGLNEYQFRLRPEKPELAEITKALEGVAIVAGGEAEGGQIHPDEYAPGSLFAHVQSQHLSPRTQFRMAATVECHFSHQRIDTGRRQALGTQIGFDIYRSPVFRLSVLNGCAPL